MLTKGLVFNQERTFVSPDKLYDMSRYKHTVTDSNITYARLNSGLYVASLNGTNSFIRLPSSSKEFNFVGSNFTLGMWVILDSIGIQHLLFCRGLSGVDGYYAHIGVDNAVNLSVNVPAVRAANTIVNAVIANTWCFVVLVRNGTVGYIYLNGIDVTSSSQVLNNPITSARNFYIGIYNDEITTPLRGDTSGVFVFNYALSASRIFAKFQNERSFFGV